MHYFTITGLVSIYWILLASVTSSTNAAAVNLASRQTTTLPDVPAACTPVCGIFTTLMTSTDPAALCAGTTSSGLQSCANCILIIGGRPLLANDALLTRTQRALNAFVSSCNAASLPVPGVLISDPTNQTTTVFGNGSSNSGFDLGVNRNVSGFAMLLTAFGIFASLM